MINAPPNVEPLRFYWNAPIEISPHNPASALHGGAVLLQVHRPRRHLVDEPHGPHQERRPLGAGDVHHGRVRRQADGRKARRLRRQFPGHAGPRISFPPRRHLDRHRRRQPAGQPGRRRDLHQRHRQHSRQPAPKGYIQISRIEPSHFDPGTAYVALDNHRNDDWKPYLFKTTDYGQTWTNVTGNLPAEGNINALREDYDNPNLLFVGTEFGLYVTLDGGKELKKFMTDMPNVRVDDILIHPRDRDLIVATHGRSFWICDDITPLEQMKPIDDTTELVLFDPRPASQWKNDSAASPFGHQPRFPGPESAGRHGHQRVGQDGHSRRQTGVPARHHGDQRHRALHGQGQSELRRH